MGCGSRTFFIQSKGCGPGNMHIKSGGVNNCATATLSFSQTFDSNSEITADGDIMIEENAIVTCENCKIRAIGKIVVVGTLKCTSSLCKLELEANDVQVHNFGSIKGSDIMLLATSLQLAGTVSTNGQGYVELAGEGKGNQPYWGGSSSYYTDSYRVSGSGAGHGGNGAAACYRYSSSRGTIPSGTVRPCMMITIILARMLACATTGACRTEIGVY